MKRNGKDAVKAAKKMLVDAFCDIPNYMLPPVLDGFRYVEGKWDDGFVIEDKAYGSRFVWIPVGSLYANGTLDGKNFNQKFGRRNFEGDDFSETGYHEIETPEVVLQRQIIELIEGFYISQFEISGIGIQGICRSVKWANPIRCVDLKSAEKIASQVATTGNLPTHLVTGAEYDTVLQWLLQSGAKTLEEVTVDSRSWGNYSITREKTGSNENYVANRIYDLAGNNLEWTQEKFGEDYSVLRGGNYGINAPVSHRSYGISAYPNGGCAARAALYVPITQRVREDSNERQNIFGAPGLAYNAA